MNFIRICLALFLLMPVAAIAAPASDASIKQLMEISETRNLVDSMAGQVKSQMNAAVTGFIEQNLAGKPANPAQKRAIDNMTKKLADLIGSELAYEKVEAKFLPVYRETFTEEEVVGMIAFYKTPTGQAVIHKMPVLMQKTMAMQQESFMQNVVPKMQEIQRQFVDEMQKASK